MTNISRSRTCHNDVPCESSDDVTRFRELAKESCGYDPSKDLFEATRQVEAGGGAEGIVNRAAARAEKAGRK